MTFIKKKHAKNLILQESQKHIGFEWLYKSVYDRVSKCAEVKAIPIETIKKEIERLKEDIKWAWYYGNTALDKMEYLKMWLEIKLEDWEAESGADK